MSAGVEQLKGSIPPLITPFRNGEVDLAGYAGLVEFQVEQGSHGILVNGTTAEPSTLSVEERNNIVDIAVKESSGKIIVVAATGSQSLAETKILSNHSQSGESMSTTLKSPPLMNYRG